VKNPALRKILIKTVEFFSPFIQNRAYTCFVHLIILPENWQDQMASTPKKKKEKSSLISEWDKIRNDLTADDVQFISRIMYRDWFRLLAKITLSLLVLLFMLIVWITMLQKPVDTKYFGQQLDGNWVQIHPLDQPILTDRAIFRFSLDAVEATYNFDFESYQKVLTHATTQYFTEGGKLALNQSLTVPGGVLEAVTKGRYVMTTSVTEHPRIIQRGQIGERYAWRVAIPVIIRYHSQSETRSNEREIVLTIVRTPDVENPAGIAISQFTVQVR